MTFPRLGGTNFISLYTDKGYRDKEGIIIKAAYYVDEEKSKIGYGQSIGWVYNVSINNEEIEFHEIYMKFFEDADKSVIIEKNELPKDWGF